MYQYIFIGFNSVLEAFILKFKYIMWTNILRCSIIGLSKHCFFTVKCWWWLSLWNLDEKLVTNVISPYRLSITARGVAGTDPGWVEKMLCGCKLDSVTIGRWDPTKNLLKTISLLKYQDHPLQSHYTPTLSHSSINITYLNEQYRKFCVLSQSIGQ